jgi:hypothetical protein
MSKGAQVAMSAVIGGTAEKLGGGKFANGAVTGAYVMMFNHLRHQGEKKRNVPSKEWMEKKANEVILKEKEKWERWIAGGGGSTNCDFNFNDYDNNETGFYNETYTQEVNLILDGKEYNAYFSYHPSGNQSMNVVTDVKPSGVAGYYGHPRGFKGMMHLQLNSMKAGKNYTIGVLYLSKEGYEAYLRYTKDN